MDSQEHGVQCSSVLEAGDLVLTMSSGNAPQRAGHVLCYTPLRPHYLGLGRHPRAPPFRK